MEIEALTPTFEDIRILGDMATVVVVYETRGTMLGNPIQGRFRYLRFWKEGRQGLPSSTAVMPCAAGRASCAPGFAKRKGWDMPSTACGMLMGDLRASA